MSNDPFRVVLLIETSKAFGRGALAGINRFVKEHEHWSIWLEPRDLGSEPPTWLGRWRGDGIIARISEKQVADMVLKAGLPTVNISAAMPDLPFPRIESNPDSQARLAARHFIERGFRNFAFCGDQRSFANWSSRVGEAFWNVLEQQGYERQPASEHYLGLGGKQDWDAEQERLARWLKKLPVPVAILAINDPTGLRILEACRQCQLEVPDDVAVLGLENDELVCSMSDPPLSSLIPNSQLLGYKAAEMLSRLMRGESTAEHSVSVEPIGIVTRQSTDVCAHYDDVVAAAVRFIRDRACDGIDVAEVVSKVNVSRSCLDRRFKSTLGRTPHQEIIRAKLKAAMQLLAETELSLTDIAIRVGYEHTEYMGVVFRRELGLSPREYRNQAMNNPMGQIPEL